MRARLGRKAMELHVLNTDQHGFLGWTRIRRIFCHRRWTGAVFGFATRNSRLEGLGRWAEAHPTRTRDVGWGLPHHSVSIPRQGQ